MASGFASFAQGALGDFMGKLEQSIPTLPKQEAKVAQYILLNAQTIGSETGKSLAKRIGVTEITVGRLMRRLGYSGTKDLKAILREHFSKGGAPVSGETDMSPTLASVMDGELNVVRSVFQQCETPAWMRARRLVQTSTQIHVTGFQSVRGLAEDFTRRLSIARSNVHYLSPHDGMLSEWIDGEAGGKDRECLILVDVIPYATEGQELARIAKAQGRLVIVVSDEFCHWSADIADACLYTPSKTGLFLESTLGLNAALALLVDAAAQSQPAVSKQRLATWTKSARRLKLF